MEVKICRVSSATLGAKVYPVNISHLVSFQSKEVTTAGNLNSSSYSRPLTSNDSFDAQSPHQLFDSSSDASDTSTADSEDAISSTTSSMRPTSSSRRASGANRQRVNNTTAARHSGEIQVTGFRTQYTCHLCNKCFSSEKYLSMHQSLHRTVAEDVDSLEIGSAEMTSEEVLTNGKEGCKNSSVKPMWTCKFCDKTFAQHSNYKNHLKAHSDERPYPCNICSIAFKERYHLKKHILFKHSTELRETCKICGKLFKDSTAVRAHERIHSEYRPYTCNICSKSFKTSECLWHHENRSKTCGKAAMPPMPVGLPRPRRPRRARETPPGNSAWESESGMTYGMMTVGSNMIATQPQIVVKSESETPRASGNSRVNSSAGGRKETSAEFECGRCNNHFFSLAALEDHLSMIHNGEAATYVCHICGSQYRQKFQLTKHLCKHYSEKQCKQKESNMTAKTGSRSDDVNNDLIANNMRLFSSAEYGPILGVPVSSTELLKQLSQLLCDPKLLQQLLLTAASRMSNQNQEMSKDNSAAGEEDVQKGSKGFGDHTLEESSRLKIVMEEQTPSQKQVVLQHCANGSLVVPTAVVAPLSRSNPVETSSDSSSSVVSSSSAAFPTAIETGSISAADLLKNVAEIYQLGAGIRLGSLLANGGLAVAQQAVNVNKAAAAAGKVRRQCSTERKPAPKRATKRDRNGRFKAVELNVGSSLSKAGTSLKMQSTGCRNFYNTPEITGSDCSLSPCSTTDDDTQSVYLDDINIGASEDFCTAGAGDHRPWPDPILSNSLYLGTEDSCHTTDVEFNSAYLVGGPNDDSQLDMDSLGILKFEQGEVDLFGEETLACDWSETEGPEQMLNSDWLPSQASLDQNIFGIGLPSNFSEISAMLMS